MKMRRRLIAATLALLIVVLGTVIPERVKQHQIKEMNQQELHYDADGHFIMLDRTTGLLGFYNACTPIGHRWVDDQICREISDGVYLAQYAQNGLFFYDRDGCLYNNEPLVLILDESILIPEGTPMLVYGE